MCALIYKFNVLHRIAESMGKTTGRGALQLFADERERVGSLLMVSNECLAILRVHPHVCIASVIFGRCFVNNRAEKCARDVSI